MTVQEAFKIVAQELENNTPFTVMSSRTTLPTYSFGDFENLKNEDVPPGKVAWSLCTPNGDVIMETVVDKKE